MSAPPSTSVTVESLLQKPPTDGTWEELAQYEHALVDAHNEEVSLGHTVNPGEVTADPSSNTQKTQVTIFEYVNKTVHTELHQFKTNLMSEFRQLISSVKQQSGDASCRSEDTLTVNRPAAIAPSARQSGDSGITTEGGQIAGVQRGKAKAGVAHLNQPQSHPTPTLDRGVLSLFHSDSEFEEEDAGAVEDVAHNVEVETSAIKPLDDTAQSVLEDPLLKTDSAPDLMEGLAQATSKLWLQGLDKKKLQEKMAAAKIPSNCSFLQVPLTNEEVFIGTKEKTPQVTSKDIQLQNTQKILVSTALPILGIMETILNLPEGSVITQECRQGLIQKATDAFSLLSHNNSRLLQQRKDMYAQTFAADIKSLRLINEPGSKELFGDDFPGKVQAARKSYYAFRKPSNRHHPYSRKNPAAGKNDSKNESARPTKSSGKGRGHFRYKKNQKN